MLLQTTAVTILFPSLHNTPHAPFSLGSFKFRPFRLSSQELFHHCSTTKLTAFRSSNGQDLTEFINLQARELTAGCHESTKSMSGGQLLPRNENKKEVSTSKKRVFFLDVNPLCYAGSTPSLRSFAYWIDLFFSQVSLTDPVIAVLDGEGGNVRRRRLLPSYKAHRRKFVSQSSRFQKFSKDHSRRSQVVTDILTKCNVPVVKVEGYEADDVVATLVQQVLQRGNNVVIASPDKDFKQLISENVQIVLPVLELKRWSFYTIKHYIAQYNCDPCSDLSLRCIMGDEVDGVPGLQNLAPGFGRKTALKLLKKHGSLENLLNAAAVRTVGKQYAQDALTKHADYLRRNYEVLALRRDVDIYLQEEWLIDRDRCNDSIILSNLSKVLDENKLPFYRSRSRSSFG